MRSTTATLAFIAIAACHSAPPPPPAPPPPLSDSATAALRWVQSHTESFVIADSVASSTERARIVALLGDARIIGVSELTEGTAQFPDIIGRTLFALTEAGVRGLVIQAPMAEAMEVDRYVRTGTGDLRRLLRPLGLASWRWESRDMIALIESIREWNQAHGPDKQLGFYGFEIPTAAHAVQVVTGLPESVTGPSLKTWLRTEYSCVAVNESAHWGLEGRAEDSTFWNRCRPVVAAVVDSVVALRHRVGTTSSEASDVAFAEQMARLIEHHVAVGLAHVTRHEANARHILYLADALGPTAKLLVWGGDVEMGRLVLDKTVTQTGVPLSEKLGDKYRAVAYAIGEGVVRTRRPASGRGGDPSGVQDIQVAPPIPGTLEDVLSRASAESYWLDMRTLPSDMGGAWLKGPRTARLISDLYTPTAPQLFQTPLEFPKFFDALVFVRNATAQR
jgi:erythromycin esterase